MPGRRQWVNKKIDADFSKIAERYNISEIFAEVLVKRGLYTWQAMDSYLFPDMERMHPPESMKDLPKAADILKQAVFKGGKILVIGDYDVDGVLSSYILVRGIELLGGNAEYLIPHRSKDGYGVRTYMVEDAYSRGIHTLMTCDNGISAMDAVVRAKELGMTFVLTDHHEVPVEDDAEVIPPADAVVNPKQKDCRYPCKSLCGAGVAYKLMQYLFEENNISDKLYELLPFAAIATVCDVVPLVDENRVIVSNGLKLISEQGEFENIGLRALVDVLGIDRKLRAGHFGFRIGPCLNAAGRLEDAALGLELMFEKDSKKAFSIAEKLVSLNSERKLKTSQAVEQAVRKIEEQKAFDMPVIVVYLEDCLESIAGIVAGRIREKYYRPALVLANGENYLKGSGRSIPEYHMQQALMEVSGLLVEFGGHAMAAGFSVLPENLDKLRTALNENCSLKTDEMAEKIVIDREVRLKEVTPELVSHLEWIEPVGMGNPKEIFEAKDLKVVSCSMCGKDKQIARLRVREDEKVYDMVDFCAEDHIGEAVECRYGKDAWENMKNGICGIKLDFLYRPEINEKYGGVQFVVLDCR